MKSNKNKYETERLKIEVNTAFYNVTYYHNLIKKQ